MRRDEIEITDFPAARRGYDRAAVDAHLAKVASEVERLEGEAKKTPATLADTAGERISSIISAAEAKAAEIEADARAEASGLVDETSRAVEGLISEANELRGRVAELGGRIGAAGPAAETPATVPEPMPPEREIDPTPVIVPEPTPDPVPAPDPTPDPAPAPQPDLPPAAEEPAAPATNGNGDASGARLVAMKMALDGKSREEVASHLAASYDVNGGDSSQLLDDVFARAGK